MSDLGLTWLLLCKFIEISDYEKAGSEVISPLQSSCPTRSGIPRLCDTLYRDLSLTAHRRILPLQRCTKIL